MRTSISLFVSLVLVAFVCHATADNATTEDEHHDEHDHDDDHHDENTTPEDHDDHGDHDHDHDDDDDSAEDDAPIDCLPDSDDDDDDAYEFLGDGDYLTIGAAAKAPESSPFLELDMGGYTLHPRYRSLTVSQKDQSEDPVNEHIVAAEALFREGFQVTLSI